MTTLFGLPAHALLVHAIVVLAPLVAALQILCALWPAARRRLVWLNLALAVGVMVLTPLTTSAGQWLYDQLPQPAPILETHVARGAVDDLFRRRAAGCGHRAGGSALDGVPVLGAQAGYWPSSPRCSPSSSGCRRSSAWLRIGDAGAQAVWGTGNRNGLRSAYSLRGVGKADANTGGESHDRSHRDRPAQRRNLGHRPSSLVDRVLGAPPAGEQGARPFQCVLRRRRGR